VTPAVILLLTDGENNEDPDPLEAAQAAVDRGVRIYAIGIGSARSFEGRARFLEAPQTCKGEAPAYERRPFLALRLVERGNGALVVAQRKKDIRQIAAGAR